MIHYSINWMGPINAKWIEENGDNWCSGRIDIFGEDHNGNDVETEIGIPPMHHRDWQRFTRWLDRFETVERVWTLDEIVKEYETTNLKITWWKK